MVDGGSDKEILVIDDIEQALVDASGSFDSVVELCEKIRAAENVLRQEATKERIRGQLKLTEEIFQRAQRLAEYRLRGYRLIGEHWRKHGKRRGRPPKNASGTGIFPTSDELGIHRTRLAEWALISTVSEKEFKHYLSETNAQGVEATLSGLLRIARAKRKAERDVQSEIVQAAKAANLDEEQAYIDELADNTLEGRFPTIYIDPPWGYIDEKTGKNKDTGYPIITLPDLCKNFGPKIRQLASHNGAHMWLWASWSRIRSGFPQRFLESCGFEWASEIVWDKQIRGTGRWIRKQTEVLIFATRGTLARQTDNLGDLQSFQSDGKHKPKDFYEIIEEFSPAPFIEIFARSSDDRKGWWYHGHDGQGTEIFGESRGESKPSAESVEEPLGDHEEDQEREEILEEESTSEEENDEEIENIEPYDGSIWEVDDDD